MHQDAREARVLAHPLNIGARINLVSSSGEGWPGAVEALGSMRELGELRLNSEAGKSLLERVVTSKAQTMLAVACVSRAALG